MFSLRRVSGVLFLAALLAAGCDSSSDELPDGGLPDASGRDASPPDLGRRDAALGADAQPAPDAEPPDAEPAPDAEPGPDAETSDAHGADAEPLDLGLQVCGNGLIEAPERCDDENAASGDGCSDGCEVELGWTCTSTPSACVTDCGDGVPAGPEDCDDGNQVDDDGCNTSCGLPFCGNLIVDQGEACDDGNLVDADGCNTNCTLPGCGNGVVESGEACDDANEDPTDGCDQCFATYTCGNGSLEPGEACDDGNLADRDGCSALCRLEVCGNGALDAGEECDDGNQLNGDGCSSACLVDFVVADYVSAGHGGIREVGTGTITLTGVTGAVVRAILYWHGPTNIADVRANAVVEFAGEVIEGRNIGFSADNCWGFANSQAYRADVTALVTGDGAYRFAGFYRPEVDINGLSLLVFFDDGDPGNDRSIRLFDGNDSNDLNPYDDYGWAQTYPGLVTSTTTGALLELHVADGQDFFDAAIYLNGAELVPTGPIFSGDSVPVGPAAAQTGGGLWDIRRFDVAPFLGSGANTVELTAEQDEDCLSLVSAVWLLAP